MTWKCRNWMKYNIVYKINSNTQFKLNIYRYSLKVYDLKKQQTICITRDIPKQDNLFGIFAQDCDPSQLMVVNPWPARSPVVTLMDFYLWGRLKGLIFKFLNIRPIGRSSDSQFCSSHSYWTHWFGKKHSEKLPAMCRNSW